MMAGCAVLTTGSGGALEIALAADLPRFPPEDAAALRGLMARMVTDRTGLDRLAARAQEVALREFSFSRMLEKWNAALARVVEDPMSGAAPAGNVPHWKDRADGCR
jgi:glycosyltransferase involved in cell wall biosynthesis